MVSEKAKLYTDIDSFRDSIGVPLNCSMNVVEMLGFFKRVRLVYHDFNTHGFCGIAFVGEKEDAISLNLRRSPIEQNFDCAHELVHLIKHRNIRQEFKCFTTAKPQQDYFLEWQANEGAAQLLVPYQDFIPRFVDLLKTDTTGIEHILAQYYFVTGKVIALRMDNLSYEIDQYRNGVPIEQLELLSRTQRERRRIRSTCYSDLCSYTLDWNSVIYA